MTLLISTQNASGRYSNADLMQYHLKYIEQYTKAPYSQFIPNPNPLILHLNDQTDQASPPAPPNSTYKSHKPTTHSQSSPN